MRSPLIASASNRASFDSRAFRSRSPFVVLMRARRNSSIRTSMSPVTVSSSRSRTDVGEPHVAADVRHAKRTAAAVTAHGDLAADGLRLELSAPDFGRDRPAHGLQALCAADAFDGLLRADGVDAERSCRAARGRSDRSSRILDRPLGNSTSMTVRRSLLEKLSRSTPESNSAFTSTSARSQPMTCTSPDDVDDFDLAAGVGGRTFLDRLGASRCRRNRDKRRRSGLHSQTTS